MDMRVLGVCEDAVLSQMVVQPLETASDCRVELDRPARQHLLAVAGVPRRLLDGDF